MGRIHLAQVPRNNAMEVAVKLTMFITMLKTALPLAI